LYCTVTRWLGVHLIFIYFIASFLAVCEFTFLGGEGVQVRSTAHDDDDEEEEEEEEDAN
jgi:hypothetical protein